VDVCDEVKVIKPLECVPPGKEWKDISDEILFDLFVHLPGDGNLCPINSLSPTSSRKISKSSKHSNHVSIPWMFLFCHESAEYRPPGDHIRWILGL